MCPDCGGTRSVPASGAEFPDQVDNGYVACPTCVITTRQTFVCWFENER